MTSLCIVLAASVGVFAAAASVCDLYMANSLNQNFRRGIFAGRSFHTDAPVEQSVSIIIRNDFAMNSQLEYFVYASDEEDYAVVVLGAGMMFNSLSEESVAHQWGGEDVPPVDRVEDRAHTNYSDFVFAAERPIRAGEEVYANYGDRWFEDRMITQTLPKQIAKARYDLSTLAKEGHCLTDVIVQDSSIPMAGRGLFASRPYKAGDIVSISPALVLSRRDIEEVKYTVLLNYCISRNDSDVALLPIGRAAMMNHGGRHANIKVEWHFWDDSKEQVLSSAVEDIMALPYSPFDLQYVATRDIRAGEELLLSYGMDWERTWVAHLESLADHTQAFKHSLDNWKHGPLPKIMVPQFRRYIEAPEGLFPSHFLVECVGRSCSTEESAIVETIEELTTRESVLASASEYAGNNFLVGDSVRRSSVVLF